MKPKARSSAHRPASIVSANMAIELWPIDRPKDYPKNARKWSAQAVEKVASSIREYGWRQPVVVDASDAIVIGHLRRTAARSLGLTEIPVHVARGLTPAQIRGLRLADNRTNQEASWDEDLLALELADLKELDFDLELTGFDVHELDVLLRDPMDEEKPYEWRETSAIGPQGGGHRFGAGREVGGHSMHRRGDRRIHRRQREHY